MPGFEAQIRSHVAPPPFGDERLYGLWPRRQLSDAELQNVTQSALVMSNPPLEATTAPSNTEVLSETGQLTITSVIRVGCDPGAQVVVCTVAKDGEPPFEAIAKIYDCGLLSLQPQHSFAAARCHS